MLPETSQGKMNQGQVLAVGEGRINEVGRQYSRRDFYKNLLRRKGKGTQLAWPLETRSYFPNTAERKSSSTKRQGKAI